MKMHLHIYEMHGSFNNYYKGLINHAYVINEKPGVYTDVSLSM